MATPPGTTEGVWCVLWGELPGRPLHFVLSGHRGEVTDVVPLVTADRGTLLASASADATIRIWDPMTLRQIGPPIVGHTAEVRSLGVLPTEDGGTLLVSTSADRTIRVWDPLAGRQLRCDPMPSEQFFLPHVRMLNLPGSRPLMALTDLRTVRLWDPHTGRVVGRPLKGHTGMVTDIVAATLPDGRTVVATSCLNDDILLWEWDGRELRRTTRLMRRVRLRHDSGVTSLVVIVLPEGVYLASLSGSVVRSWELPHGRPAGKSDVISEGVGLEPKGRLTLVRPPDGNPLLILAATGGGRLLEPRPVIPVGQPLNGHTGAVTSACALELDATRALAVTGGVDHTVRLWNLSRTSVPGDVPSLHERRGWTEDAAIIPTLDGRGRLAIAHVPHAVRQFDLDSGELAGPFLPIMAECLAVLPEHGDGMPRLAVADRSTHRIVLWDPGTGRETGRLRYEGSGPITAMVGIAGEHGSPLLVTACSAERGLIRVWDTESGEEHGPPLVGHHAHIREFAVAERRGLAILASVCNDGALRLWGPREGVTGPILNSAESPVLSVTAVPRTWDQRAALVSTGADGTLRVWDPVSCRETTGAVGPAAGRDSRTAVVHVPHGGTALAVAGRGILELWDPLTGTFLHAVPCPPASSGFLLRSHGAQLAIVGGRGVTVLKLQDSAHNLRIDPGARRPRDRRLIDLWAVRKPPDGMLDRLIRGH
nr:hypothetical protein [Streptomyces sp. SID3343]